jgi:hypothetical protein
MADLGLERDSAMTAIEKEGGLVLFACHLISNVSKLLSVSVFYRCAGILTLLNSQPDLPLHSKDNLEHTHYPLR